MNSLAKLAGYIDVVVKNHVYVRKSHTHPVPATIPIFFP